MNLANLTLQEFTAGLDRRKSPGFTAGDSTPRTTLRRCRTREQGSALIAVGHAIEYLLDSRLIKPQSATGAEREALAILLNANLTVYNEGAEIVPIVSRLRHWFHGGNIKPQSANVAV